MLTNCTERLPMSLVVYDGRLECLFSNVHHRCSFFIWRSQHWHSMFCLVVYQIAQLRWSNADQDSLWHVHVCIILRPLLNASVRQTTQATMPWELCLYHDHAYNSTFVENFISDDTTNCSQLANSISMLGITITVITYPLIVLIQSSSANSFLLWSVSTLFPLILVVPVATVTNMD